MNTSQPSKQVLPLSSFNGNRRIWNRFKGHFMASRSIMKQRRRKRVVSRHKRPGSFKKLWIAIHFIILSLGREGQWSSHLSFRASNVLIS